ncbi:MAG: hypothetical protein J5821_00995 [Alphaproteobacteria bacterium]|nr:hypothetical protein [Alphaproteobacteria bacterium]
MDKITKDFRKQFQKQFFPKKFSSDDSFSEANLADESLSDCLEFLIRTTPTTMPEWMN